MRTRVVRRTETDAGSDDSVERVPSIVAPSAKGARLRRVSAARLSARSAAAAAFLAPRARRAGVSGRRVASSRVSRAGRPRPRRFSRRPLNRHAASRATTSVDEQASRAPSRERAMAPSRASSRASTLAVDRDDPNTPQRERSRRRAASGASETRPPPLAAGVSGRPVSRSIASSEARVIRRSDAVLTRCDARYRANARQTSSQKNAIRAQRASNASSVSPCERARSLVARAAQCPEGEGRTV